MSAVWAKGAQHKGLCGLNVKIVDGAHLELHGMTRWVY